MANKEHLAILRQGVEVWNKWILENSRKIPNLKRASLKEAELEAAYLKGANFQEANLAGAHLASAHLASAHLERANLRDADLQSAHLVGAHLEKARLERADLFGADLSGVHLVQAHLEGAFLVWANLREANLAGSYLTGAYLEGADLEQACLRESDLHGSDFNRTNLIGVDATKANFSAADLREADLSRADLRGANLSKADLRGARLDEARLDRADLSEAILASTSFIGSDLSTAQGLDTVHHIGPTKIDIDTLIYSHGKISEAFLRGCGVPDSFIEYLPALIGAMQPIQYYSCFISHSTKDNAFAKRLCERMQAEHLRVWFAPEDIKGGEKLYEQIDRAIQRHDRLLLVLSENSINSEWVMAEIRRARRAELKERRRKLFPIRLVDYDTLRNWECFDADHGKDLAVDVREYFIPDFSNWKDHDAFEVAFSRLLRDLKTTETKDHP